MDYSYKYKKYKLKYLKLKKDMDTSNQSGGGMFDWFWGQKQEEPKLSSEAIKESEKKTDIITAKTVTKPVAEWLYSIRWVPWSNGQLDLLDPKIFQAAAFWTMFNEDGFNKFKESWKQLSYNERLSPYYALEYLLAGNKKMDKDYVIGFLQKYIELAITDKPAKTFNIYNDPNDIVKYYYDPLAKLIITLDALTNAGGNEISKYKPFFESAGMSDRLAGKLSGLGKYDVVIKPQTSMRT